MDHSVEPRIDVLLVEDSLTQAKLVQLVVERVEHLHLVQTVEDGVEAMAYLRGEGAYAGSARPGLVLLDINMPRMNGFEVLHAMKTDPELRRIPVVMLTTSSSEEDVVKSYEDGASTYITKPVELKDLLRVFEDFSDYWKQARLPPAS